MQPDHEVLLQELQQEVSRQFLLPGESLVSYDQLLQALSGYIQQLLNNDFHRLVLLLYRTDISEQKLKKLLAMHPEKNTAKLIANLIIERLLQKIKTRQQFRRHDNDPSGEERWE